MNKKLSPNVIDVLMKYDWPGNVRELENLVERLMVITPRNILSYEDLPLHLKKMTLEQTHPEVSVTGIIPLKEAVESVERQILELAYSCYGTTREMASKLGVDASTVVRKAAKYRISQSKHIGVE
ncbi:MAG TPA: TyrR/PhhR family helix-turn-helix DNA-binding protein [Desulfosporosinus sp.]|nr:TyrR/PhhR family helix-turn-helix DNA-binding protein [Desulfosporosinus sp.]